jgi:Chaperone of endosialidase
MMRQGKGGRLKLVVAAAAVLLVGVPFGSAQTDVLNVVNNNVGIGTTTPTHPLHVFVNGTSDGIVFAEGANATDSLSLKLQHYNGVIGFALAGGTAAYFSTAHQNDALVFGQNGFNLLLGVGASEAIRINTTGKVGIGMTSPTHLLDVGTSGAFCDGGLWVAGSSRAYKQDIHELSTEAAEEAVAALNPVTYEYKAAPTEHHVGFIAEDVPDLVAMPNRKGLSSLDIVAVLTKVVQQQQKAIAELQAKVAELEKPR